MPKWLIYSLLTALSFGVWGVLFKALGDMSAFQSQAFCTLGILPILAVLAISPNWHSEQALRGSMLAFAAGALVGLGNIAYYHAVALGSSASAASALTALYPVVSVLLSFMLLQEKPHAVQLIGIGVSVAAIYLLSGHQPGEAVSGWVTYALVPIALWGGASIVMKLATRVVSAERATFWFLAAFVPLAALIVGAGSAGILEIQWHIPGWTWFFVALLGAAYGLGNLSLLAAYRNDGKVSIVTPLSGLYPIVTIPLAMVFFGEGDKIGVREWAGIGLALAGGVALAYEPEAEKPGTRGQESAITNQEPAIRSPVT